MPLFQYTAISDTGQMVKGKSVARDRVEILQMLRDKRYYPVSVKDIVEGKDLRGLEIFGRVSLKHIAVFCRQFYTMLNAGITVIRSLSILTQQTENKRLNSVIGEVHEEVQKGATLSEAFRNHRDVFPEILINMVEAGELSGRLDTVMGRMANHFEKEHRIRMKIMSSMIYPIILSIAAVGVVIFLLIAVLPVFKEMFDSSGVLLPAPTRLLLSISSLLKDFWHISFLITVVTVYLVYRYIKSDKGGYAVDRLKLQVPGIKGIMKKIATSRFTRTLSILLSSGISLMRAMDMTAKVVGNKMIAKAIYDMREEMRKGADLSGPVKRMGLFPPMVESMIKIGEESGALDEVLEKTATFYDSEVDVALQRMVTLLEPILIIIMAVIIGFIVISIALPLFDLANTIK